jgi:acetolactate synthase I/II/III large subunit
MPRTQQVVDHIVEHLARIEIDYIFGVDGANIEDLYDAAHFRSDITAVLAKHEISDGQVKDGDVVMMAAFAHAGDFAGAAAVRLGGRS